MDSTDKRLVFGFLEYINEVIRQKKVSNDAAESLQVAIQCLSDSCEVDVNDQGQRKQFSLDSDGGLRSVFEKFLVKQSDTDVKSVEDKDVAEKWKTQGNIKMAEKNYEEAIDFYTRAIGCYGKSAVYYANRAAAYSHVEKYMEAVKDCKMAIEVDPTYSKSYSRLAVAYHQLSQYENAVEAYDKALEFDPENEQLKNQRQVSLGHLEGNENGEDDEDGDNSPVSGGSGMPDLSSLLNNPNMKGMFEKLAQNPNVMQMAQSMMEKLQSGGKMPNFGDMLNNPQAKQMMESMMKGSSQKE